MGTAAHRAEWLPARSCGASFAARKCAMLSLVESVRFVLDRCRGVEEGEREINHFMNGTRRSLDQ